MNKISKFLKENPSYQSQWKAELSRGSSLGELQAVLRIWGCSVSKRTLQRYLKEENLQLYSTKIQQVKKVLQTPFRKLSNFWIKPPAKQECKHLRHIQVWDMYKEKVIIFCKDCEIVLGEYDPETNTRKSTRNAKMLYNKLRIARERSRKRR